MTRRACRSRRCRSSRGTGRASTTGVRVEARLNALPQFLTEIDGLDIHFIHVRSPHEDALPLIITHGWPGSIIELLKIIGPLTDPTAHGGERRGRLRRGGPLDARLRVLGQADDHRLGPGPHRARLGRADAAPRLHPVRRAGRRLGRRGHAVDGRAGRARAARHPLQHAGHGARRDQCQRSSRRRPAARRSVRRRAARLRPAEQLLRQARRVRPEMATRPQTLYGLADSPVALAAWMLDQATAAASPG